MYYSPKVYFNLRHDWKLVVSHDRYYGVLVPGVYYVLINRN
jgi:hypothetical protein